MGETLKDKAAKGFLWGFLNNGMMQILNAVFGIVLARKLSQDDYGLIGMLTIFTTIAGSLQDSGFITALTNRKNATHEDFNSVFWFNIGVSASLYVLFFFIAPFVADFYDEPLLCPLFRYYSLGFFFASFSIVPRTLLFKQLKQKELTVVTIVSLLISGIIGITMAFMGLAYWGLATQTICYTAFVSVLSWAISGWRPSFEMSFRPIREMFGFSSKMLLTNIFNQVNQNIFSVVLGKIYTKSEVGLYNQANKWNIMGAYTIIGMVQGVAQPTFVKVTEETSDPEEQKERLCRAFSKMLKLTSFVSFPAMFGLALVAPEFIVVLITDKWLPAAELMRILCICGAFLPINTLYFNLIISRGKSNVYMWNIIAQGVVILASVLVISILNGGVREMVWTYVAIVVSWVVVWNHFVWREIGFTLRQLVMDIAPFMAVAAVTMLVTYIATLSISNIYLLLLCRIALAVVIYCGLIYLCGAQIMKECLGFLLKKK